VTLPRRARILAFASLVFAAFLPPVPPPAEAHPPGGFGVQCGFSHASKDDPIMHAGHAGGSPHRHAFYGNRTTDAYSTRETLLDGKTTCSDAKDLAATWAPTAFIKKHGEWQPIVGYRERTYYFPSIRDTIAPLTDLPANIKMIGGNPHATSRADNPAVRWFCGEGSPEKPYPYDCRPYTLPNEDGIRAIIDMPFCWDGDRLDSPDHVSHVIYSDPNDTTPHEHPDLCPSSHPKYLPAVSIRIHFSIKDPCTGLTPCGPSSGGKNVRFKLSSGPYWTMHADFWNTWIQSRLHTLTDDCLRAHKDCGILGAPDTDE
jgi:Domain of unknown function (DUF1996)